MDGPRVVPCLGVSRNSPRGYLQHRPLRYRTLNRDLREGILRTDWGVPFRVTGGRPVGVRDVPGRVVIRVMWNCGTQG